MRTFIATFKYKGITKKAQVGARDSYRAHELIMAGYPDVNVISIRRQVTKDSKKRVNDAKDIDFSSYEKEFKQIVFS